MKIQNILLTLIAATALLWTGCDKVNCPYDDGCEPIMVIAPGIPFPDTTHSTPNTTMRMILLEEFTGHTCTNCPIGTAEVARLTEDYDPQIIPVAIHAGIFAEPTAAPYEADYRTEAGNQYDATFAVWGNPTAMVSRVELNGDKILGVAQWEPQVQAILNAAPVASIDLTNLYNDTIRLLRSLVHIDWLTSATGSYKLQLFCLEDSIIGAQLDGSTNVENYVHKHMLRGAINGTWGTDIPTSAAGDTAAFSFDYSLIAGNSSTWNEEHLSVVAFIYESTTFEVVQVTTAYVKHQ